MSRDPRLVSMLELLWSVGRDPGLQVAPAPERAHSGQIAERLLVMPRGRFRYLVSDGSRAETARILASYNGIRSPLRAAQRTLMAGYVRCGLPRHAVSRPIHLASASRLDEATLSTLSFPAHLRALLREPRASVAVGLRRLDHHSKPTVQLFGPGGSPLAYAKLGWSPSTAMMVRRETSALERFATQGIATEIRSAGLLASGDWGGHPYLVVEPLPAGVRAIDPATPPSEAARAVAGRHEERSIIESAWWHELERRVPREPRSGEVLAVAARAAMHQLRTGETAPVWEFGAWHGDWVPWNVAKADGQVFAWDWEHFAECAPIGFDSLHWTISTAVQLEGTPLSEAIAAVRDRALADDQILLGYLVEMAARTLDLARLWNDEPVELIPGLAEALTALTAQVGARPRERPGQPGW
jgi:hypothetical protein